MEQTGRDPFLDSLPEEGPVDLSKHHAETVADLHARAERAVSQHQRKVETVTAALGRPFFFYCLLGFVGLWVSLNLGETLLGLPPFDPPPFFWLQGLVTLCALLMTTAILITQNRLGLAAKHRALLDLHINLLAEQKITKLIALVEELRNDMPSVSNRRDAQAEAMAQPVNARAVVATLEHSLEHAAGRLVQEAMDELAKDEADDKAAKAEPEPKAQEP